MATFTKTQQSALREILRNVDRASAYLRKDSMAVCMRSAARPGGPTCPADGYQNPQQPGALHPISIECGSDLVGLWDAGRLLRQMLSPVTEA